MLAGWLFVLLSRLIQRIFRMITYLFFYKALSCRVVLPHRISYCCVNSKYHDMTEDRISYAMSNHLLLSIIRLLFSGKSGTDTYINDESYYVELTNYCSCHTVQIVQPKLFMTSSACFIKPYYEMVYCPFPLR